MKRKSILRNQIIFVTVYFCLFFLPLVPQKLKITLKNEVKNAQHLKEGVYSLASDLINRKPHWYQLSGTNSICWLDRFQRWCVGPLGDYSCGLMSTSDVDVVLLPQEVTKWKYPKGKKSEDMHVEWVYTTDLDIGN